MTSGWCVGDAFWFYLTVFDCSSQRRVITDVIPAKAGIHSGLSVESIFRRLVPCTNFRTPGNAMPRIHLAAAQKKPASVSGGGLHIGVFEAYFLMAVRSRRSQSYQAPMPSPVVAETEKISMSLLMDLAKALARSTSKLT